MFLNNDGNRKAINDYQSVIQDSLKCPRPGMRLLGKLMMALAVAGGLLVGLGVAVAGSVGALPAVGVTALGMFSAGAYLVHKAKVDENELIDTFTKRRQDNTPST
jgi:hypothetical protein